MMKVAKLSALLLVVAVISLTERANATGFKKDEAAKPDKSSKGEVDDKKETGSEAAKKETSGEAAKKETSGEVAKEGKFKKILKTGYGKGAIGCLSAAAGLMAIAAVIGGIMLYKNMKARKVREYPKVIEDVEPTEEEISVEEMEPSMEPEEVAGDITEGDMAPGSELQDSMIMDTQEPVLAY